MKQLYKLALISLTLCALPALGVSKVDQAKEAGKTAGLIAATGLSVFILYKISPFAPQYIDRFAGRIRNLQLPNDEQFLAVAITGGALYGTYYFGKKALQRLGVLEKPIEDQPEEIQAETDLN